MSHHDIHVHPFVPLASTESDIAIQKLGEKHGALFECLQLTVGTLGKWDSDDVARNMRGGILTETDDRLPPELKDIRDALDKPRLYEASNFCAFTVSGS